MTGTRYAAATAALLLAGCVQRAFGQGATEVRMLVQPFPQVEYILGDTARFKEAVLPAVRLPEGDHHLVFWAPNCTLLDTVLHVSTGGMMEMRKVLRPTPEYITYHRASEKVWLHKAMWKGIPMLFTLGFGLKGYFDHRAHDQAYDDLHALRDSYPTLLRPSDIEGLKQVTIPAAQQDLEDTRRRFVTSVAACGVGALATVYGFIHARKLKEPPYEDKEKVKFEGLAWLPVGGTGMYVAGISIPLE